MNKSYLHLPGGPMEVVPLRELKTNHDFSVKGRMLRLRIDTCGHDGFIVQFIEESKVPEGVPDFVLRAMGFEKGDSGLIEKTVVSQHVHPRWYDRIIGKSIEDRVKDKIMEIKKDFKEIQDRQDQAERLAQTL